MPYNHYKINILEGGWYAVYSNGEVVTEDEMPWLQVPNKKDIKIMGLKRMNKHYELEGKENFCPPGETHMRELIINPGEGMAVTKQTLVGWYIGYYDKVGKVITRINAQTGVLNTEIIPYDTPPTNTISE
jgi:hypothetical protein